MGKNIEYTYIDEINSLNKTDWKPLETYWIEQFKVWGFEVMNKNKGGGGPIYCSSQTKEKISTSKKNHKHSYETIQKMKQPKPEGFGEKISKIHKGLPKPKSEETIQKLKKPRIKGTGEKISLSKNKSILQYDLKGNLIKEWPSVKTAAESLSKKPSGISFCLTKKQKTAFGYVWVLK